MKKVTPEVWQEKAANFQSRIAANPYPKNLDHYRKIVEMVTVGDSVADIGCGAEFIKEVLPAHVKRYQGFDPFPRNENVIKLMAEDLCPANVGKFQTVFCLAALDNVECVVVALEGIRSIAGKNVVILTGIGVPVDHLHTHTIERKDLTDVLGEPAQEIEISKNIWLFEFFV